MASKYQTKWEPNQENREFWEEVLVGRKITQVNYNYGGIESFVLDSGELITLTKGPGDRPTIAIQDDV
jgi:hypothetical protein